MRRSRHAPFPHVYFQRIFPEDPYEALLGSLPERAHFRDHDREKYALLSDSPMPPAGQFDGAGVGEDRWPAPDTP